MSEQKTWYCKIGESANVPKGGDGPMREAISRAYEELTGESPEFIFSGWGAELTESERAVVEDRFPDLDVEIDAAQDHLAMLLDADASR